METVNILIVPVVLLIALVIILLIALFELNRRFVSLERRHKSAHLSYGTLFHKHMELRTRLAKSFIERMRIVKYFDNTIGMLQGILDAIPFMIKDDYVILGAEAYQEELNAYIAKYGEKPKEPIYEVIIEDKQVFLYPDIAIHNMALDDKEEVLRLIADLKKKVHANDKVSDPKEFENDSSTSSEFDDVIHKD